MTRVEIDRGVSAYDSQHATPNWGLDRVDQRERPPTRTSRDACVDLFAPGVDITSTWLDGGTNTISGTSMASPHVAGVAAQYLQTAPGASPSAVNAEINGNSTKDAISDTDRGCTLLILCTPAKPNNHLLFSNY